MCSRHGNCSNLSWVTSWAKPDRRAFDKMKYVWETRWRYVWGRCHILKKVLRGIVLRYLHLREGESLWGSISLEMQHLQFLKCVWKNVLFGSSEKDLEITPRDEALRPWAPVEEHASEIQTRFINGAENIKKDTIFHPDFLSSLHRAV